ncbi:MAG: translation elongation factor Ts [Microthrixaceae bacterium]|nr:translation elongation factor Ts [Microthrixaceae bacterium]
MADFTAKDVQALRQASGAGMMDAKRALTENDGDPEAAAQWLREKGLAKAASRSDRENNQGAVAVAVDTENVVGAIVELKSETDFVAKSDQFKDLAQEIAALVLAEGEEAATQKAAAIDELKVTLKENIELGRVVRFAAAEGNLLDTYLHVQSERGVNAVLVELSGGTPELAHDLAVHIAFTKPPYRSRDEVPAADVEAERQSLEAITKAEGKPEQAWPKIIEGRLNGWYKERVLLDQAFVRDEKQTVTQLLGDATLVRFAQVVIGA